MQSDHSYRTTPQTPIHSGFRSHTTAREVLRGHDLMGKTALVTGGNSGIGLETTRALAEAGATVIVPARTPEKARASMGGMPRVELEEMDLIDPASYKRWGHLWSAFIPSLHYKQSGRMQPYGARCKTALDERPPSTDNSQR
jgi:short chain dehydrogenase